MPTEGLPNASEPDRFSRRNFFKKVGGGLAATTIEGRSSAENSPITSQGELVQFESKYNKIDFKGEHKEIPPEVSAFLKSAVAILNETLELASTDKNALPEEKMSLQRKSLYEAARKAFPGIPAYSYEAYLKFVVYDLPRYLAPYGIFVKSISSLGGNPEKDTMDHYELMVSFQKVGKVESAKMKMWGKDMERDILYIQELEGLGEQKIVSHFSGGIGQTFYQNIIIFTEHIKPAKEDAPTDPKLQEVLNFVATASESQLRDLVAMNKDKPGIAAMIATAMLLAKKGQLKEGVDEEVQNVITHETSHLYDTQDTFWREKFRPIPSPKFSEAMKYSTNLSIHEEIDGLLGEMGYDSHVITFQDLMMGYSAAARVSDLSHSAAGMWIMKQAKELVSQNPAEYGVRLSLDSRLSEEDMFLLQFPNLLDRPEVLHALAQKIWKIHRTRFDEDFTQEQKTRIGDGKNQLEWGEEIKRWSAPVVGVGASLWVLKKILDRRQAVQEAERKSREKQSRQGKKSKKNRK